MEGHREEARFFSLDDVVHTLRECDLDRNYDGRFENMLTFASMLTGISEHTLAGMMYDRR